MKIVALIVACVLLGGCASTTYSGPPSKGIVYGVDGNGNALRRARGEPPPRASAAQACLRSSGCAPEHDN